ncbi:hypothetical protein FOZ62_019573 [Perkinsus olseni]|uniref:Uncharacterized protein n=1 Tax=Perkinsus olseni TaxID=32597 RepID=A0A7J6R7K8_PEROL|nr:hypothetical protein FOZ62_019573 [Perkinsus olseni]
MTTREERAPETGKGCLSCGGLRLMMAMSLTSKAREGDDDDVVMAALTEGIAVKLDIIPTNNYIEGSMHDDDEDEEEGEAWFTAICISGITPTHHALVFEPITDNHYHHNNNILQDTQHAATPSPPSSSSSSNGLITIPLSIIGDVSYYNNTTRDDECEPDDDDDTSLNGPVIILDLPQCSKIMHIQCVMDRHADAWFKALTKLLSDNGSGHYLKEEEDNPNQTTTSSSPHADTTSDADTGEILTEESYEVVDESNDDDDDDSEDYTINTTNGGDDDEDESSDDDDGTSSEGEEGHYDDDDDDDDDDSLSIQTEISLLKSIVMQRDDIIQNMQREGTRSRCVLLEEQNNLLLRLLQEREDTLEDVFNLCELLPTLHNDPAAGSGGDDDDNQKRGLQSSPPLPPLIPLYQGSSSSSFDQKDRIALRI